VRGSVVPILMKEAAGSLGRCTSQYWPSRYSLKGNAIGEANIVNHLAHACLKRGYFVYPEAAHCGVDDPKRRLDLLVFMPRRAGGTQLRVQAKRRLPGKPAALVLKDIEILEGFRPNEGDNPKQSILRPARTICLFVAVTHSRAEKDWWRNPVKWDRQWDKIGLFLRRKGVERGSNRFPATRMGKPMPSWLIWAYWSVARLPTEPRKRPSRRPARGF